MKPGNFHGGFNMSSIMKQAQKMQQDIAEKQAELNNREYSATVGGGAVTVKFVGKILSSVLISPDVVNADDIEMLQDLIIAAVNEALKSAEEDEKNVMQSVTGGLNLPL